MSIKNHFNPYDLHPPITKFITDENGKRMSAIEWGRLLGISPDVIRKRMKRSTDPKVILRTDNLRGSNWA